MAKKKSQHAPTDAKPQESALSYKEEKGLLDAEYSALGSDYKTEYEAKLRDLKAKYS